MRGMYTAFYRISGNSTNKTLLYITAPSAVSVDISSASVTNESNETNEQLVCVWQKVNSLGTPTATTLTPTKHESGDQAAASTVKANVTASEPSYTSNTEVGGEGFPSLSGWFYAPPEKEQFTIAASATYGLRLLNAMISADLVVKVIFLERG